MDKLDRLGRKLFSLKLVNSSSVSGSCAKGVDLMRGAVVPHMGVQPVAEPKFWFANRTQVSVKADRQIKEYFYHCIRNIDYPMRINYCWNFSPAHENYFRRTFASKAIQRIHDMSLPFVKRPKLLTSASAKTKTKKPKKPKTKRTKKPKTKRTKKPQTKRTKKPKTKKLMVKSKPVRDETVTGGKFLSTSLVVTDE